MKTILFFVLLAVARPMAGGGEARYSPAEREALLRDWKTIRFSFYHDGGDFVAMLEGVMLQRLPSRDVLLSVVPSAHNGEAFRGLPAALGLISEARARHL